MRTIALLSTVSFLMLFAEISAQNSIIGSITSSETSEPIAGAFLYIDDSHGASTNDEGLFEIGNLPDGKWTLIVTHVSYDSLFLPVTIDNGQNKRMNIQLSPGNRRISEVVVSATRNRGNISDIPSRVHVITISQLQDAPARTADDLLSLVPSVSVDRTFGIFSTKAAVTMRGMSGKEQSRVLVMIDGIPLNKSDGGTVNWNQLDPDEIERIEVVKGPVSSLYGGNAMGGAINMISRVPVKELSGKITAEYGTYNTRSLRGNLNGLFRQGKNKNLSLYWGMNAFRRTSDGYITQSEADQAANPYITASTVDEWGAGGKIGMTIRQNHRAEISLSRFDDFRGMGEVVFQEFGNVTEHDAWLGSAKYLGTIGQVKINSALYFYDEDYKKVNEYMKDDYTFYKVLSNRLDKGFFTSLFFPLHESHKITTGVDYKIGSVDASDVYYTSTDIVDNAGKMQTFGFFLQDEKSFLDEKIRVILGFRTDYARFYDGNFILHSPTRETEFMTGYAVNNKDGEPWLAFSPKISGMYRPAANTRYYVSWARGFRPSVLDDLCRSGRVRGGFKVANTDLKPEYISSFEAGIDHDLNEKLEIRGTGFLSLGKDFLYYVNTGDSIDMGFGGRPVYVRSNISGVRIIGLETELNYNLRKDMRISVSYTFNDARITNYTPMANGDTIDLTNNFLTDVPAHSALATFTWSGKPVHISLVARYLGKRFINDLNAYDDIVLSDRYPDYFTLDIRIQKKILKYILAGAEVQNLLDAKFYDSKGAVCPGRFITCFIGLKF